MDTETQFECVTQTKAPIKNVEWMFKNQSFEGNSLSLNLTRSDFNQELECVVENTWNGLLIGRYEAKETIKFDMDPIIVQFHRLRENNYEFTVESRPIPHYVRISTEDECNDTCIMYTLKQGKYVRDQSPFLNGPSYVNDVIIEQVKEPMVQIGRAHV